MCGSIKPVRGNRNATAMGGIDFNGRFDSVWDQAAERWIFSTAKSSHHAMQVWNAISDGRLDVIRAYLNEPEFDWKTNLFVIPPVVPE
jgi:hypothetical protein